MQRIIIPKNLLQCGLLFFLITSFLACRQPDDPPQPAAEAWIAKDLRYGDHDRHRIDVKLPAGRTDESPFLILIHGGSWTSGDKQDLAFIQDSLFQEGIGSASINYRYVKTTVNYPELMDDVRKAIDFCARNSDEWQIPETNYLLGGVSAGAHMALLYAYGYNEDQRIAGVISGCGPTDFTDTDWLDYASLFGLLYVIEWVTGASYVAGQPLDPAFYTASPIHQDAMIPTLMIHGDQDAVVFYSQSLRLRDTLEARGVAHKLVTIPGAGHDLGIANPGTQRQLLKEMRDWCYAYGRP